MKIYQVGIFAFLAGVFVILVAACTSMSSMRGTDDEAKGGEEGTVLKGNRLNGVIYYLPEGRIRITGNAGSGSNSTGQKPDPANPPGGDSSTNATPAKSNPSYTVTIAADIEADHKERFYLKPDRHYLYDDDIHLVTNAKQLLSTGNATAEDETAQIIATTAQIVAQGAALFSEEFNKPITVKDLINNMQVLGKFEPGLVLDGTSVFSIVTAPSPDGLGPVPAGNEAEVKKLQGKKQFSPLDIADLLSLYNKPDEVVPKAAYSALITLINNVVAKWSPEPFSVVFDPNPNSSDYATYSQAQGILRKCGYKLIVTPERVPSIGQDLPIAGTTDGIVFRPVIPYRITLETEQGYSGNLMENEEIFLPDTEKRHERVLDYSRMSFVKKVTNVGFIDGVPQDFSQTVPSPVVGFLAIPKAIVEAIVPNPIQPAPKTNTPQGNVPATNAPATGGNAHSGTTGAHSPSAPGGSGS